MSQELKEDSGPEKQAIRQIEREIREAEIQYRDRIKKEKLDEYNSLIVKKKEAGKYFFMGQWLSREEISALYRFIRKKDRSWIFYLCFLALFLLLFNVSIALSFFPNEMKTEIFSYFLELFK